MRPVAPPFEIGSYPQYGFDILELLLNTNNTQTRQYRVFWYCCRTEGVVCHRPLAKRMKRAEIVPCVVCTRKINGASILCKRPLEIGPDLFVPNLPSKPTFPKGVVSAALAWPVPGLVRASVPC